MPATFDGAKVKEVTDFGRPRSSKAEKHMLKAQKLIDRDAPDSKRARRRNEEGLEELKAAAELGCVGAAFNAAEFYWNGSVPGIRQDYLKAANLYLDIFDHPSDVAAEIDDEMASAALVNFIGTIEDHIPPNQYLVIRMKAVASLPEWRVAGKELGRRVRMVMHFGLGYYAWISSDRVFALRSYQKAVLYSNESSLARAATTFELALQQVYTRAVYKVKQLEATHESLGAAAVAAQKGDCDEADRIVSRMAKESHEIIAQRDVELKAKEALLSASDDSQYMRYESPGANIAPDAVYNAIERSADGTMRIAGASSDGTISTSFSSLSVATSKSSKHGMTAGVCAGCSKPAFERRKLLACPCKMAYYCSADPSCQRGHWKVHKSAHKIAMAALN